MKKHLITTKMSESPRRRSRSPKHRETDNSGNNLYISNLSYKTEEQDLHDRFSDFGKIKNCKVIKDPYTKQSRGFGFVTFESSEDAARAQSKLDGTSLDGRELRIEVAKRSRAYSPTPGNYLGNPKFKRSSQKSPRRSPGRYDSPKRSPRRRYDSPRRRYDSPRRRRSPRRYSRSRS
jgi:transformer-2 protein